MKKVAETPYQESTLRALSTATHLLTKDYKVKTWTDASLDEQIEDLEWLIERLQVNMTHLYHERAARYHGGHYVWPDTNAELTPWDELRWKLRDIERKYYDEQAGQEPFDMKELMEGVMDDLAKFNQHYGGKII